MQNLFGAFALLAFSLATTPLLAADAPPAHSVTFDSAGVKIAYVEAGRGQDVVLVHGLYSSALINWILPGIFDQLAKNYHVVAFDLRGHGNSDKPAGDAAYGQPMVDDITRLMDHLKIKKAHIVGYSLGGIVAMKFIIDHPDRTISCTLGGMGWLREGSWEPTVFEHMGDKARSATPPACVHGIAKLAVTQDQIKQIKIPLEMLVGDHDPCKALYVDPLAKLRPDFPVVVIDNAGHLNCIVKEQFQSELGKWLAKNGK